MDLPPPLIPPLDWSFVEASSPLALCEGARTPHGSLPVFFSSPPPAHVETCQWRPSVLKHNHDRQCSGSV